MSPTSRKWRRQPPTAPEMPPVNLPVPTPGGLVPPIPPVPPDSSEAPGSGPPAPLPGGVGPPAPPAWPDPLGAPPPAPGWWLASDGRWYPPTARPGYGYGVSPARPQRTNGLAIASLVLGITWWGWIGSVLAVIFGHIALLQIREHGQAGRGMAVAGLVLGYLGMAVLALFVIVAFSSDDWASS